MSSLHTEDFAYDLPPELIAQEPCQPRDACRLLVLNRKTGECVHRRFFDISDYLNAGDLLVLNETRVLPARLQGKRADTGGAIEVLLLRATDEAANIWECLVKPGKRVRVGTEIVFGEPLSAHVDAVGDEGLRIITFTPQGTDFKSAIHALGTLPLPPYIKHYSGDPEQYQTVFATDEHSAAAPTAGLHFTPELLEKLQVKGIQIAKVRLDVGLDTFRPVSEEDPSKHPIHTEYYEVPQETVDAIDATRERGGRIVAVGTTVVRALESSAQAGKGKAIAVGAPTSLFILPGYDFKVVDVLLTNFHVPRSTLMMLVSAFASREQILTAYGEAIEQQYRLLSFGDAMLIQ
jgi:S-adenosylmethionine:tRNA ribosyltransferase-isomerase